MRGEGAWLLNKAGERFTDELQPRDVVSHAIWKQMERDGTEHVWEDLNGKIEMIIDGGSVDIGLESTILDMTVSPPMILRPGAITADMLEEVIGVVSVDETILGSESSQAPKAPGMKYRHYAPKAKLTIVEGSLKEEVFAIRQLAYEKSRQGVQVGIIGTMKRLSFIPMVW
mgnify:CR=1 FL=1